MCFAIRILMLAFAQNPKHCTLHQLKREVRIEAGGTHCTLFDRLIEIFSENMSAS